MSNDSSAPKVQRLRLEAVFWDWRLRDPHLPEEVWQTFRKWHAVAAHREMLDAVAATRRRMQSRPSACGDTLGAQTRRSWTQLAPRALLFIAMLATLGPGTVPPQRPAAEPGETFQTRAAVQVKPLRDGSIITAAPDTRVRIELNENERTFYLSRGRAFFQVAYDPMRPFIVRTPSAIVHADGTRFAVSVAPRESWVTVLEGIVEVASAPSNTASSGPLGSVTVLVGKDEQVRIFQMPKVGASFANVDSDKALRWATAIQFEGVAVREALEQFNQRTGGLFQLSISASAYALPISGIFSIDRPEAFAMHIAANTSSVVQIYEPGGVVKRIAPPAEPQRPSCGIDRHTACHRDGQELQSVAQQLSDGLIATPRTR